MAKRCKSWCELRNWHRGRCKKQCKSTGLSSGFDGETRCQLERGHKGRCEYAFISNIHTCTDACLDVHP